jgi:hypothetical protein
MHSHVPHSTSSLSRSSWASAARRARTTTQARSYWVGQHHVCGPIVCVDHAPFLLVRAPAEPGGARRTSLRPATHCGGPDSRETLSAVAWAKGSKPSPTAQMDRPWSSVRTRRR